MSKRLSKRERKMIAGHIKRNWQIFLVLFVLIVMFVMLAFYMGWTKLLFKKDDDVMSTAGGYITEVSTLKDLKVNFLDVGQGDTIIINLPDGKNMIIDSGENNDARNAIAEFTTVNGISTFDYLLLTHQDSDHAGNMSWVIDNYDIKYIFRPNNYSKNDFSSSLPSEFNLKTTDGYVSTTKTYAKFMVSAYNEKCTVEIFNKDSDFQNKIKYNGLEYSYSFNFLTPTADKPLINYNNPNDYSPIMLLEYGGRKIMFTGDAEEDVLEEYVTTYGNMYNVDILKLGHHGSRNATNMEFVEATDPEIAIIQCGLGNSYGHPHIETLNTITGYDSEIKVYRNDTNGDIVINFGLDTIDIGLGKNDCSHNLVSGENMLTTIGLSAYRDFNRIRQILMA